MIEETIRSIVKEEIHKFMAANKPRLSAIPDYLNPAAVEKHFGIPKTTLSNLRCQGRGPAFSKHDRTIVYRRKDVEAFIGSCRVRTSFQPD
jgi:hypothetical protein